MAFTQLMPRTETSDAAVHSSKIIFYHGPEFHRKITIFDENRIYPLQRISFEGYELCVPANINEYLTMLYGESYMQFPHGGAEHHDMGRGALKTWAKKNNINMHEIYEYLSEIKIE